MQKNKKTNAVAKKTVGEKVVIVTGKEQKMVPIVAKKQMKAVGSAAVQKVEGVGLVGWERDAVRDIGVVADKVGVDVVAERWSPLGHMAGRLNGKFDCALLKMCLDGRLDFVSLVSACQEGSQAGRKSSVEDNAALVRRLQYHFQWLAGRCEKSRGSAGLVKALAKVGKAGEVKEIQDKMYLGSVLFDEYVAACAWK